MSTQPPVSESKSLSYYLQQFSAFKDLEQTNLDWLASRSYFYKTPPGKLLFQSDRLPDHCYCLVRGKGRVLHHDPSLRRPVTLAFCQPGDLLGWSGLARRAACEWITASTELYLIGFTAETFYELESRSSAFRTWLDNNNSPAELMSVIHKSLVLRAHSEPADRDVLRLLVPHMKLLAARDLRVFRMTLIPCICGTLRFQVLIYL